MVMLRKTCFGKGGKGNHQNKKPLAADRCGGWGFRAKNLVGQNDEFQQLQLIEQGNSTDDERLRT
jgi:hypothetical protein